MFLSDLVPNVVMQIPGCTDDIAMKAIVDGARRFYRESTLWRDSRSYSLVAGADVLRLRVPEDTEVASVRYVTFEGTPLDIVSPVEFGLFSGVASRPRKFSPLLSEQVVRIAPAAGVAQDNSYNVELVLVPSREADELPVDNFASEFESAYEYAALAKLFAMPAFMNLNLAAYNESLYADLAQRAMNKAQGLLNGGVLSTGYGGL